MKKSRLQLYLLSPLFLIQSIMAQENQASQSNIIVKDIFNNWQFRQIGNKNWYKATVPGTVHTDLIDNKLIPDPFYRNNEKDLQWIDKVDWEYKCNFNLPENILEKQHLEISFKGLDTYADVYLNGEKMLSTNNMFREWPFEAKKLLKKSNNELLIYFHSPTNKGLQELEKFGLSLPAVNDQSENGGMGPNKVSPFVRKAPYHFGWDWGPRLVISGIWRPVVLNAWNDARILDAHVEQKISKNLAEIIANFEIESSSDCNKTFSLSINKQHNIQKEIALQKGINKISIKFNIENPQLWWPNGMGKQNLYKLETLLSNGKQMDDQLSTTFGIRNIQLIREKDKSGEGSSFYFNVNKVPVFAKGANYIPNDVFLTRVKPEDYEFIVKSAADAHMNMIRVWGGGIYEENLFYDLCDKYGIMVWQDFMFACSMYLGNNEFLENIKQEAIENVKRIRNHPCLALWCGNNEIDVAWQQYNPKGGWGWKQLYKTEEREKVWKAYDTIFNHILPTVVKDFDMDHFYWPSSPLADFDKHSDYSSKSGDIHYWDVWWGQKPFIEYNNNVGRFMSEYGFQSFPEFSSVQKYAQPEDYDIFSEVMKAHQRSSIGNGTILNYMKRDYNVPADFEKFLYVGQLLQAEGIKSAIEAHRRKAPYCMGSLYWQINDCWPVASWSGIDFYKKWKAVHYFIKKAFTETSVIPYYEKDSIQFYVVTDRQNTFNATLSIKLIDFSGKLIWEKQLPVKLKHNESSKVFETSVNEIIKGSDKSKIFIKTELIEAKNIIAENTLYLLPIKDLVLPVPNIQKQIAKTENGYSISFKSDVLAKNVYLNVPNSDVFFSNNYFDLLPGKEIVIELNTKEEISILEKNLKIISLRDTY